MVIRPEKPSDFEAIRHVHVKAFANHPFSRQTEHLIVDALRNANALTISLVAEDRGNVIGHIAFSPVSTTGLDAGWYTLGPVGVLPDRQRQGIGSRLIAEGIKALKQLGAKGCVMVGDPDYYRRFGFRNTPSLGIQGVPPEYFMCLPFTDQVPQGYVTLHPAFFVSGDHV